MNENRITTILLALTIFAFGSMISAQAQAIELLGYKDTNNSIVLKRSTVETVWASNQPACLKDGARLLGVNKAFKAKGLGYRDCSNSDAKKRVHKAQGITVTVIKLSELPMDMIKEITSKK